MTERNPPLTAEDGYERLKAKRRLRLMELHEETAARAETETHERLRAALRQRYVNLIGVQPEQRHAFRIHLENLKDGVKVDWLLERFARDGG